jgi:hypothetical protein
MKTYGTTFPQELIAAGVGGLPFSWAADGSFNFDDSITPEQRATIQAVADAHDPLATPVKSALEQIRALEAQYSDQQARLSRQSLLILALDRACNNPAAAGLSRDDVNSYLLQSDPGYAAMYNLEMQVQALRGQV